MPDLDEIAARGAVVHRGARTAHLDRAHDQETPITLAQLGELLYRACAGGAP
ncbi:hypothetical protein [Streptosporangium vulgare]|uniref:hypothetical protein n=1 Tax=Streptosporangium vulgare TaxID=46190 RepID=UPI0031DB1266